jgi:sodium/potassium/calcium exchanger 6
VQSENNSPASISSSEPTPLNSHHGPPCQALTAILFRGEVTFFTAVAFFSIYILYGIHVAGSAWLFKAGRAANWTLLKPVASEAAAHTGLEWDEDDDGLIEGAPGGAGAYHSLDPGDSETDVGENHVLSFEFNAAGTVLPQWMWTSHVAIYGLHSEVPGGRSARPLWGWDEEEEWPRFFSFRGVQTYILEGPLLLPRRVTIPFIESDGWSRGFAVASVVGAPFLLALVFGGVGSWLNWMLAGVCGLLLGGLALGTTIAEHPPRTRWVATLWCAGGFVMSVAWFYLVANELVAVLIALGVIAGIDPALLGLTVLAWGNSIGDLVANTTIAAQGGAQMAVAGCYAGPMFNMLVGTGMSLVLASWRIRPEPFQIPKDMSIFVTLAFLAVGLLFALVYVPFTDFKLTRTLGVGLIAVYSTFMLFRIALLFGLL